MTQGPLVYVIHERPLTLTPIAERIVPSVLTTWVGRKENIILTKTSSLATQKATFLFQ